MFVKTFISIKCKIIICNNGSCGHLILFLILGNSLNLIKFCFVFIRRYETGNGIFVEERGVMLNKGTEDAANSVVGSYKYISPEGVPIEVTYTAGVEGFKAYGAHLPVGPSSASTNLPKNLGYQQNPSQNPFSRPRFRSENAAVDQSRSSVANNEVQTAFANGQPEVTKPEQVAAAANNEASQSQTLYAGGQELIKKPESAQKLQVTTPSNSNEVKQPQNSFAQKPDYYQQIQPSGLNQAPQPAQLAFSSSTPQLQSDFPSSTPQLQSGVPSSTPQLQSGFSSSTPQLQSDFPSPTSQLQSNFPSPTLQFQQFESRPSVVPVLRTVQSPPPQTVAIQTQPKLMPGLQRLAPVIRQQPFNTRPLAPPPAFNQQRQPVRQFNFEPQQNSWYNPQYQQGRYIQMSHSHRTQEPPRY